MKKLALISSATYILAWVMVFSAQVARRAPVYSVADATPVATV